MLQSLMETWQKQKRTIARHLKLTHKGPVFLVMVLCAMPGYAWARASSNQPQPPKAISQSGVIEINGCVIRPKDLLLTATPMRSGTATDTDIDDSTDDDDIVDPRTGTRHVRKAHISATSDPHVLTFIFHALKVTKPYTIDVHVPPGSCGRMTWIGPSRGVIMPGQQSSVNVKGFSLTTQIDVESTDANGATIFRGADALDDTSESALARRFRWHTDLADATDVELQIAADRFPSATETPSTCSSPSGLLTKVRLNGKSGISDLVDFSEVLHSRERIRIGVGSNVEFTETISNATRLAFANGAPLFVRAIPLRADGTRLCNLRKHGAAGISIVRRQRANLRAIFGNDPSLLVSGEYHPAQPVAPFDYCVRAIKPHLAPTQFWYGLTPTPDPLGYQFYAAGQVDSNGWVQPGAVLCWNNSTSVIDDVGNFVTGFVDGIASIVNFIANLYDSVKSAIVTFVAKAITAIGIECKSDCQAVVNGVLSTALTAMGLPPSLPNFDALVNDGLDYLKAQIAEQSGLPQVAVDKLTNEVISAASAKRGGGGGLPDWVVADNGFRPARLVLDVFPNPVKLSQVPNRMLIHTDPLGLYSDVSLPLPSAMRTGTSFKIPVQLPPDLSNTADMPCAFGTNCNWPQELVLKLKLMDWYGNRFAPATCSQFALTGLTFGGPYGMFPLFIESLGTRAVDPQVDWTFNSTNWFCQ